MGFQSLFSKLKKKLKHLGSKRKPGGTGAGADGEGADPAGLVPQPVPYLAAGGGHDGGQGGSNADGCQVHSIDKPPRPDNPETVPNDEEGGVGDVDRWEGGATDEGEGKEFHSRLLAPSIPCSREPDGVWAPSFQLLPLIVPSDNIGTPAIPDCILEVPHPGEAGEAVEPSTTTDENTLGRDIFATVDLLCGVRDCANAFSPLRSIAGTLCFILEKCKVWQAPVYSICNAYSHSSKQSWIYKP